MVREVTKVGVEYFSEASEDTALVKVNNRIKAQLAAVLVRLPHSQRPIPQSHSSFERRIHSLALPW